jgi:hypothetical protein
MTETRSLRCAIYTRKSTEEGLDQAFNSLQAQRESGEHIPPASRREAGHCCRSIREIVHFQSFASPCGTLGVF